METYQAEATVSQDGPLVIRGVPFKPGDKVKVIVLGRCPGTEDGKRYPLRGKPFRYLEPFESVAEDEWDALRSSSWRLSSRSCRSDHRGDCQAARLPPRDLGWEDPSISTCHHCGIVFY